MTSALFFADGGFKRVQRAGPCESHRTRHRHPQKNFLKRRISQIASSHVLSLNSLKEERQGNASLRLRFDSNLNRVGTPQGGREA